MKFLIFGAGALGQALGCMLAAKGHHVELVLRKRYLETIGRNGLTVQGLFGEFSAAFSADRLHETIETVKGPFDYILLTTKTYDTADAIRQLKKNPINSSSLVSMQNGCGNVEQLKDAFGEDRIIGARVITGFEIQEPGLVNITVSADSIHVGSCRRNHISDTAAKLARTIDSAGHPCKAVSDIYKSLFSKLLYNCTLNPLGAILGVHYGRLSEHDETIRIMNAVIDETFAVITAMGGKTDWPSPEAYRETFYRELIPATYHHRPSMLQDLENNKPTEIDSLAGYISRQGIKFSVKTPNCDFLTSLVKFKENSARL